MGSMFFPVLLARHFSEYVPGHPGHQPDPIEKDSNSQTSESVV
jgi:hypothetical protein